MIASEYKSTAARLARLFRRSRDNWKQRAAQKQRTVKKLRITIRDVSDSRDHWKGIARRQAEEIAQLKTQLRQAEQGNTAGGF
jgi:hypothetical protein